MERIVTVSGFDANQGIVIASLGFIGWLLCGAAMGIGLSITTIENTLILHAIAAPIIFIGISWLYFTKFNYTRALTTAVIFIGIVILLDFFIVAMVINRSFDMFYSPMGTWIPFILIFGSTYLTGFYITRSVGYE